MIHYQYHKRQIVSFHRSRVFSVSSALLLYIGFSFSPSRCYSLELFAVYPGWWIRDNVVSVTIHQVAMSGSDQDGGRSSKRRRMSTNEGASSSSASAEESGVEAKVAKPVAVVVPVKREAVAETRGNQRNAQIRRIEDRLEEVVRNLLRRRLGNVLRSMPISEVMGDVN